MGYLKEGASVSNDPSRSVLLNREPNKCTALAQTRGRANINMMSNLLRIEPTNAFEMEDYRQGQDLEVKIRKRAWQNEYRRL